MGLGLVLPFPLAARVKALCMKIVSFIVVKILPEILGIRVEENA
jgi:hypothetical protein